MHKLNALTEQILEEFLLDISAQRKIIGVYA